jgi:hypothetical protein
MVALVVGEGIGRPRFGHPGTWFAIVALIPGIGLLLFLAFGAELRSAKARRRWRWSAPSVPESRGWRSARPMTDAPTL